MFSDTSTHFLHYIEPRAPVHQKNKKQNKTEENQVMLQYLKMGITEATSWDRGRGDCWIHWGWRGPLKSFLLSPHLQHAASAPRVPCLPATRHPRTAHSGSTEPNSLGGYDWQNDKPIRRQDVVLGGPSLPDTGRIFSACYDGERAARFHPRSFSAD